MAQRICKTWGEVLIKGACAAHWNVAAGQRGQAAAATAKQALHQTLACEEQVQDHTFVKYIALEVQDQRSKASKKTKHLPLVNNRCKITLL